MANMLERIRKILAQAEDQGNTPEARKSYLAKAIELMQHYRIDEALAYAKTPVINRKPPVIKDMYILGPYTKPKWFLFAAVAASFGCEVVQSTKASKNDGVRELKVFGFDNDIESSMILYTSLLLQGTSEVEILDYVGSLSKSDKSGFWYGYHKQIGERLKALKESTEKSYEPGTAIVLRDRGNEVTSLMRKTFPRLAKTTGSVTSVKGYSAGIEAANRANLHTSKAATSGNTRAIT